MLASVLVYCCAVMTRRRAGPATPAGSAVLAAILSAPLDAVARGWVSEQLDSASRPAPARIRVRKDRTPDFGRTVPPLVPRCERVADRIITPILGIRYLNDHPTGRAENRARHLRRASP